MEKYPEQGGRKGLKSNQVALRSMLVATALSCVLAAVYHYNQRRVNQFIQEMRASIDNWLNPKPKPAIQPRPIVTPQYNGIDNDFDGRVDDADPDGDTSYSPYRPNN